jgi:hypothetical protein
MSMIIRPTSRASVQPGRLLGARKLADVVRRLAASPRAGWAGSGRTRRAAGTSGCTSATATRSG